MKKSTIEYLKKKNSPIPKKLFNKVSKLGVITGSTVFGGFDAETSDIDIIIPISSKLEFRDFELYFYYDFDSDYEEDFYRSCYVLTENGSILNLLFFWDKSVEKTWLIATKIMKEVCNKKSPLRKYTKIKKYRIEFFEWLKDTIDESKVFKQSKKNYNEEDVPF